MEDIWSLIIPRTNITVLMTLFLSNFLFQNFIRNNFHKMTHLVPKLFADCRDQFVLSDGRIIPINVSENFHKLLLLLESECIYVDKIFQTYTLIHIIYEGKLIIFNTREYAFEALPSINGTIKYVSSCYEVRSVITEMRGKFYEFSWNCRTLQYIRYVDSIATKNSEIIELAGSDEAYRFVGTEGDYEFSYCVWNYLGVFVGSKLLKTFYDTCDPIFVIQTYKGDKYSFQGTDSTVERIRNNGMNESRTIAIRGNHIIRTSGRWKLNITNKTLAIGMNPEAKIHMSLSSGKNTAIDIFMSTSKSCRVIKVLL